ncbi:MAG: cupin domain-containing protein [Polyangia bacterium]
MSAPTGHIDDRIAELLFGDVGDSEREKLEAHLAGCPRCADELVHAADAFAQLALALPAEAPPPALRARILADLEPPRLAPMLDKLASLFDVTRQKARALIDRLDDPSAWINGPVPNSWVMAFDGGGPKVAGAFCGFVKVGPRVQWPAHRHLGREYMLVLEGGFQQDDGFEVHPGDVHVMEEGSSHAFTILDDETCIAAAVVFGGVAFADPSYKLL